MFFFFASVFQLFFSSDACVKHLVPDGNLIYFLCVCVCVCIFLVNLTAWSVGQTRTKCTNFASISFLPLNQSYLDELMEGVGWCSACQLAWTTDISFSSILLIIIMRLRSLDANEWKKCAKICGKLFEPFSVKHWKQSEKKNNFLLFDCLRRVPFKYYQIIFKWDFTPEKYFGEEQQVTSNHIYNNNINNSDTKNVWNDLIYW